MRIENAPATGEDSGQFGPFPIGLMIVLSSVSMINYIDRISLSLMMEPVKRSLHLTDGQMGLVSGAAFALFYAVLGLPIARIADRGFKRWLLPVCVLLWSVMTIASGAAVSFATLFVARMLVGVGEAGCVPTSFAIIADHIEPRRRPIAISLFQAGGLLGVAIGMVSAGYATQFLGWRNAMMIIGAAGIPVSAIAALVLRRYPDKVRVIEATSVVRDLRDLFRQKEFVRIVLGISLAAFGSYSILQWMPAFFMRLHYVPIGRLGLAMALSTGGGGIVGMVGGGIVATRLVRNDIRWDLWLPAATYAISAPLFLLALVVPDTLAALGLNFVATVISASGGGTALSALQRFSAPGKRATANAFLLMLSALLGVGLGPVFIGVTSDLLAPFSGADSLRWALALSTIAFLGAAGYFMSASRGHGAEPDVETAGR